MQGPKPWPRRRPAAHRRRASLHSELLWRLYRGGVLSRRLHRGGHAAPSCACAAGADAHRQSLPEGVGAALSGGRSRRKAKDLYISTVFPCHANVFLLYSCRKEGKRMLNIENVSKRYGKTLANDGVSFAVAGGELAVLLGPNGAGKSTLIKCVAGLLRFEGNIQICGHGKQVAGGQARAGLHPGNAGGVRPFDRFGTPGVHAPRLAHGGRRLRRGAASPLRDVGQARQTGQGALQGHAAEAVHLLPAGTPPARHHLRRADGRPRPPTPSRN